MPGHCSWNATYESLLGSTKPFAQQIPLPVRYRESISHLSIQILFFLEHEGELRIFILRRTHSNSSYVKLCIYLCIRFPPSHYQEMVDFLVNSWEQEGLYD
jgi:hypothetical protein